MNNNMNNYFLQVDQQERINTLVQAESYKYWLGGFAEGEGALLASLCKNDRVSNKFVIQPEFNVTQHVNGINILYSYKVLFNNLGTVHKKSGSEKVWVYSLKGIDNIENIVIPFFEKYVVPYSCKHNKKPFSEFCYIINKLFINRKKTMDKKQFIELVKLTYKLNPQGKGKHRKRTLDEVLSIINKAPEK